MLTVAIRLAQSPESAKLGSLLEALTIDGDFKHVSALANQAKHRSIVFPSLNEDFTGRCTFKHAVSFPSFEHEGASYTQVFAEDFLKNEYARCSALVVAIGGELNAILSTRVS